jgi:hypothetical protein
MKIQKKTIHFSLWTVPLALLGVCILTYGLLIPKLGLYWDDWSSIWFNHLQGARIFKDVFSSDRPFLGRIFMLTMPLFGDSALKWQAFALTIRWLLAVTVWWSLRKLWPEHELPVAFMAFLSAVYPGFSQQWIAITYGHILIPYVSFVLSLGLMVWAIRKPGWFWPLMALSLLTDAFTLFLYEYYVGLELLRPVFLWLVLSEGNGEREWPVLRKRLGRVAMYWAPFIGLILVFIVWRLFIQEFSRAQVTLFSALRHDFLGTSLQLVKTIFQDILVASLVAWGQVLQFTSLVNFDSLVTVLPLIVVVVTSLLTSFYLNILSATRTISASPAERSSRRWAWQVTGIGVFALLIAGWPTWITDLPIRLGFHWDRFTLSMLIGVSLVFVGLLELLFKEQIQKIVIVGLAVGLAAGFHFQNASSYQKYWEAQRSFFWQMAWRVPGIKPGTALMTSGWPFLYFTDNSLTAPLNWIYDPNNHTRYMAYLMVDIPTRLGKSLPGLDSGMPITEKYRATSFAGNTSQALVFYFDGSACFRILEPGIDGVIYRYPDPLYHAIPLSRLDLILTNPDVPVLLPSILRPEPMHEWCYYYEKADLAAQVGDWLSVVDLGTQAQEKGYLPYLSMEHAPEYLPFIEGYAHTGDWQKAQNLTSHATSQSAYSLSNALCLLWGRIEKATAYSAEQQAAIADVRKELSCLQP